MKGMMMETMMVITKMTKYYILDIYNMFKENINHFIGFLMDEYHHREKKMEISKKNKKRNYFMFALTYIFIFLLLFRILNFF
jgi:hypothetical protein